MLQFIAQQNDRFSIPELSQMAIEGGCKWIILRVPDYDDAQIRELAAELVPLCKETSTLLTIENHVEMAKELGLHGVHLRNCPMSARAVREMFGPDGIIGVEVGIASAALPLAAADVDYVTFPPSMSLDRLSENIEALREAKYELPIVYEGTNDIMHDMQAFLKGANGLALSTAISNSKDPVKETEEILNAIAHP